jgi:hemerythrin-like domain-containing protein
MPAQPGCHLPVITGTYTRLPGSQAFKEARMLLTTYALSTLLVEQQRERTSIALLEQYLARPAEARQFDCAAVARRSEELISLAESRHHARLEHSLFPALRIASAEAATSVGTMENLRRAGIAMLPRMRFVLRPSAEPGQRQLAGARRMVRAYCQNLRERLACEEDVLLPLAQRILPSEAWFKVGSEFLQQDARRGTIVGIPIVGIP